MTISERFLQDAMKELLLTIMDYDSDTFFAKGANVTQDECFEIAGRLIHNLIDHHLDGVQLDVALAAIRGL